MPSFVKLFPRPLRAFVVLIIDYFFMIPFGPLTRYKEHLLQTSFDPTRRSSIGRLLYPIVFKGWIHKEYLKESDPDQRERMKAIAMGGTSGAAWAAHYDNSAVNFSSRIGTLSLAEACPIYPHIESILESEVLDLIIQVGSSSGREVAYFSKKFPSIQCIGTDIYSEIVEYSREKHGTPNLSFELCPADKLFELLNRFPNDNVLIFSSGSLQYVQPEHLKLFFNTLVNAPVRSLKILLVEPASEIEVNPDELGKSLWRGNFSFTHDYRHYSESAGLITVMSEIIRPYLPYEDFHEDYCGVVHYFLYCQILQRTQP